MNRAQLLQHFDTLAETPDAVEKLRKLILDFAIRGRLVPQNPKDEPASELIRKIQAEQTRVVQDKGAKEQKSLPPITPEEVPYQLPTGWAWERLGNIGTTNIGLTYSPQDISNVGIPVLRSSNVQNGKIDLSDLVRVDVEVKESVLASQGDLLICARNGSRALVGKVALIDKLNEKMAFGAFMAIFRSSLNNYLYHFIRSSLFRRVIADVNTTTINQITQNNLRTTLAPIPPLAEQRRIVAKVGELLALCDELEAAQTTARERRTRLVRSALDHLTTAQTEPEFRHHAAFVLQHSDLVLDSVATMRQAILSLAVQGRLVSQSSEDKSASLLVEDLIKARGKLAKGRKSQDVEPATEDAYEVPHQIPVGWEVVRLGEIADIGTGSTPSSTNPEYYEGGTIPWITSGATSQAVIESAETCVTDKAVEDFRLRLYEPGTIIIALYGQGKTRGQVSRLRIKATVNQACATIMFPKEFESVGDYLMLVLRQQYLSLREQAAGGAQPNLNGSKIKNIILPLPPLAEQQRIVAKVDELMRWCDALETRLTAAQTTAAHLLDATLHQILAA